MNTDKAAAAVHQNARAIEEAKQTGGLFGAVTKCLGDRGFEVTLRVVKARGDSGQACTVQATPRKLFQGGKKAPIRIAVGHVVLLAGELRAKGDLRPQLRMEIMGRLDSKAEIRELIKMGLISSEVLGIAETAGAIETSAGQEVAKEDLFEGSDGEDFWTAGMQEAKGGLKQARQAAETVATIAARVATLNGQREGKKLKGLDGGVAVGDMADPQLFEDPDYERFKRWRAHKATARAMAGGGSSASAPVVQAEAALTVADLLHQFKLEQEAARTAAEQRAIVAAAEAAAKGAEAKAWIAKQAVKENWDDEEVNLEDL